MWTVTISLVEMDLSNFRSQSSLTLQQAVTEHTPYLKADCVQQLSECGTSWPELILPWHLSWLKHRMRTEYKHVHWSIHTWHSSIKHSSTMTVWNSLVFQMHFFPLLFWNEEILIPFWPNTFNSQSSEGTASQKQSFKFPAHTEVTKAL